MRKRFILLAICLLGLGYFLSAEASPTEAGGSTRVEEAYQEAEAAHGSEDHISSVLLAVGIILLAAKLGGHLFEVVHMPAVLGELIVGVVIGNLWLCGFGWFEFIKHEPAVQILAEIGIIILLFEVGLETSLKDLMRVGLSSLLVAILGVITPFFLGFVTSRFFLPDENTLVHVFIGATLCATSVGITARVLQDIGKIDTDESRIVLGAAVIDDVMGLVILAIVTGAISAANQGGTISGAAIGIIFGKAGAFFVVSIAAGILVTPHLFKLVSRLKGSGLLLATGVTFCFAYAALAAKIGLAPIVGAFCAGLILEEMHLENFKAQEEHNLETLIAPISYFLVPIFFVLMGIRVDLSSFAQEGVIFFALVLTVAAIVGKQICSLGVLQKGVNRLAIGIGMVPRGEVGLIFAGIGTSLKVSGEFVIGESTYAAVVIMVIITTLFTPPLLKAVMLKKDRAA